MSNDLSQIAALTAAFKFQCGDYSSERAAIRALKSRHSICDISLFQEAQAILKAAQKCVDPHWSSCYAIVKWHRRWPTCTDVEHLRPVLEEQFPGWTIKALDMALEMAALYGQMDLSASLIMRNSFAPEPHQLSIRL